MNPPLRSQVDKSDIRFIPYIDKTELKVNQNFPWIFCVIRSACTLDFGLFQGKGAPRPVSIDSDRTVDLFVVIDS